jgi:hypothetical protein
MPVYGGGTSGSSVSLFGGENLPSDVIFSMHPLFAAGSTAAVANVMRGCRIIVPKAGTISSFFVFMATSSGNIRGSIYDTGQASATVRTRLWDGGSTVSATNWLNLGNPALSVAAGDQLDFAVMADNAVAAWGRTTTLSTTQMVSPAGYNTPVTETLLWSHSPGSFANPSTIAEAGIAAGGFSILIAAGIS